MSTDPPIPINTLKQAFCRTFSFPPEEFERRALLASFYPHARCLTFFGGNKADRFLLDRALVSYCGRLHSTSEVEGELREFATHEVNRQFQRRVLKLPSERHGNC